MISINPATGEEIARYDEMDGRAVEERLARAATAFARHRALPVAERAALLERAAALLDERARPYAELMTAEMGKPVRQAEAEARKCAWVCRHYAAHAEAYLRPEEVATDAGRSYVAYQPLGPVLAVMPWNFPFWQVIRFAAPALAAGNVALLKHASNVTGCALAIEALFADAGFEAGAFQTLVLSSKAVNPLIADPRIRAVTLTGSEAAGRAVGAAAGEALKPIVLELGGSDPYLVLADADLARAVEVCVRSRMQNNSQSCIAAKRFIVEAPVYDAFIERYARRMEALVVGDPMDEATEVGPLVRAEACDEVHDQVQRALAQGARLVTGGRRLDRTGFYYAPTVLADVEPGMVPFVEEIFGPVAAVARARDADHAVALANDSTFGLGSAVFTADTRRGEAVALRLEAGSAFVNDMVRSDPRLPFGGVKDSGVGRELSHHGLRAFVNVKTVWIA